MLARVPHQVALEQNARRHCPWLARLERLSYGDRDNAPSPVPANEKVPPLRRLRTLADDPADNRSVPHLRDFFGETVIQIANRQWWDTAHPLWLPAVRRRNHQHAAIPVVVGIGRFLGVRWNLDRPIAEAMTKEGLITAPVGTTLDQAEKTLGQHRIEKLPVLDEDGKLRGLITVKDMLRRLIRQNHSKICCIA